MKVGIPNMKKEFVSPEIEIIALYVADIITTSDNGDIHLPFDPF